MPYSKNPESFAQIYYDLLDLALESRTKMEIRSDQPQLIISRFYGFTRAWGFRAAEAEKMGNMPLAAENKKKQAALMRYLPHIRDDKKAAVFMHKDALSDLAGERLTASEERVDDPLLDAAAMFARAQLQVPESETLKGQKIPNLRNVVNNDGLALKLFGVDTSKRERPQHNPDGDILSEEEMKELLEIQKMNQGEADQGEADEGPAGNEELPPES